MKHLLLVGSLIGVALGACGGGLGAVVGDVSGDRLRLQWAESGDVMLRTGVYDADRGESCTPVVWEDGQARCTPYDLSWWVVYTDAACTRPVAVPRFCASVARGAYAFEPAAGCGNDLHAVYPVTTTPIAATTFYSPLLDGTCIEQTEATGRPAVALGPAIPAASFVTLDATTAGTGDIRQQVTTSADGLELVTGAYDARFGGTCVAGHIDGDRALCTPSRVTWATNFGDDACSTPLAATFDTGAPTCSEPATAATLDTPPNGPSCDATTHYRTLGEPYTGVVYSDTEGTCSLETVDPRYRFRRVGAEVELVPLQRSIAGTGRLRIYDWSVDGELLGAPELHDTALGVRCRPRLADDDTLRCLPETSASNLLHRYRDAACTDAILVTQVSTFACPVQPVPAYVVDDEQQHAAQCGMHSVVYAVGARVTGQTYYKPGDTCIEYPVGEEYLVGDIVPAATFAAMTTRTDP